MRLSPIVRPYRALALGTMTIQLFAGLFAGVRALTGAHAIAGLNRAPLVGWPGLWTGLMGGCLLGAFFIVFSVPSLWLGNALLRWIGHAQSGEPSTHRSGATSGI